MPAIEKSPSPGTAPAVALALQGGGALGAYHIGAYEALHEAILLPGWVCGVSIGAFRAALIAGNPPDKRIAQLNGFWDAISRLDFSLPANATGVRYLHNAVSYADALVFGQPNFFVPRNPLNLLLPDAPSQDVSFYDTRPVLNTLQRFVRFPITHESSVWLSLGATDVESGLSQYFDSTAEDFEPAHVLASGSLPPGFPATPVGDRLYWDGGCVSNTPIDEIVTRAEHEHLVVFMVDLWNLKGKPPRNTNDVLWRAKQIQYASRSRYHLDKAVACARLGHSARQIGTQQDAPVDSQHCGCERLDIVHVVYPSAPD